MQSKTNSNIGWNFDNSYARLPQLFYTKINPEPVPTPNLVVLNQSLTESLGLNPDTLKLEEGIDILAGNKIPDGSAPIAQAYAGHQFGYFTMLGDGRAVMLGEHIAPSGDRFDIQFKGSGKTPYSRGGDGRAVLGPMLREYIISEAMHGLGIPTSRSLAVVTTGERIMRETSRTGAILTRVATSHLRVGTFEYVSKWGTEGDLCILADYAIQRHFPYIEDDENKYIAFLKEVIKRQASLIAKWQLVGFIHGVMNTDNMTISGETIDYGPCAFMDIYNPETVFSSIDTYGRYAYGNQPYIAPWNLSRFAEALLPLIHEDQDKAVSMAQKEVTEFNVIYKDNWLAGMRNKLGINNEEPEDEALIESLLSLMEKYKADFTNTFRMLTLNFDSKGVMFSSDEFKSWHKKWLERLERNQASEINCKELMKRNNPAIIPRNHRVEEALKMAEEQGNYYTMDKLLEVLKDPYAYSPEQEEYTTLPEPTNQPYVTFCGT